MADLLDEIFERKNPMLIIITSIAVAVILVGLGYFASFIIEALGVAIAIAAGAVSGGIIISTQLATAASIGLAVGGGAIALTVVVKFFQRVQEKPHEWMLPASAIVIGILTEGCSELYDADSEMTKVLFGGGVAVADQSGS